MSNAYLQSIDSTLSAMNLFSLVCCYKNFVVNCVTPLCTAVQLVLITVRWQYVTRTDRKMYGELSNS